MTATRPSVATSGGTGTSLPLRTVQSMVVDDAHQYVFVTGKSSVGSSWELHVLDFTGNLLNPAGLSDEADSRGMALVGSTLYIARCADDVIDEIDTATLTRIGSIAIPQSGFASGYDYCALAAAGGKLWFHPNDQWSDLTGIDIAAPHTVTSYPGFGTFYNPQFATVASAPDLLVVSNLNDADTVAFDTSGAPPAATATGTGIQFDTAAVTPDGQDILVPGSAGVDRRRLSDFSLVRTYPVTWNGYSEAVSADGSHVAIASNVYARPGTPADVWVFPSASTTPNRVWRLPEASDQVSTRVAFLADVSKLFVVTSDIGAASRFHVLSGPTMQATTLTASTSRTSVTYGNRTTITARLSAWGTNRRVTIWKQPHGGKAKPVASGNVGGTGAFSVTVAPKKNTTYWATYGGDSAYVKSTSPNRAVTVHVIVRGAISGFYASSGGYHLYHSGVHPVYQASVTPAHPGKCTTFVLEVHRSNGWYYTTQCFAMNRKGRATVYLKGLKIGKHYRIGAAFQDKDHGPGGTAWAYLRVTS